MGKEETNDNGLIIKMIFLLLIIGGLFFSLFMLTKSEKNISIVPEHDQMRESMLQLRTFAEKFKQENGFYNNSEDEIESDFCSIDKNNFAGTGIGHIICSIMVNNIPGGLVIYMNNNKEEVSMYCFQKAIKGGVSLCIDNTGYFGESSGCNGFDYKCH